MTFGPRVYPTGLKRPECRGWLHVVVALALLVWIPFFCDSENLRVHLFGKFICYSCSATLHIWPHRSVRFYSVVAACDCGGIIFSILSGCILWRPEMSWLTHHLYAFGVAAVVAISAWQWSFAKASGAERAALFWMNLQGGITFVYFLTYIGIVCGSPHLSGSDVPIMALMFAFYVGGFTLYQVKPEFAWHQSNVWTAHEDFHVLLFFADAINFVTLQSHAMF